MVLRQSLIHASGFKNRLLDLYSLLRDIANHRRFIVVPARTYGPYTGYESEAYVVIAFVN